MFFRGPSQTPDFSRGLSSAHSDVYTHDHQAWRALSEKLNSTGWSNEQKHVLLILESCYFEIPADFQREEVRITEDRSKIRFFYGDVESINQIAKHTIIKAAARFE